MTLLLDIVGLCLTAGLIEFLLLRHWPARLSVLVTIVIAGLGSGVLWMSIFAWLQDLEWGWKTESESPMTFEAMLVAIYFTVVAAVIWSSFGLVSASIVAWVHRRLSSHRA
jgi:hypothetical protein